MGSLSGDWICPINTCSNLNFAKREVCNRCGTPRSRDRVIDNNYNRSRPSINKQGHYNDWLCEYCGNTNWSRRTQCNICKQPKPTSTS